MEEVKGYETKENRQRRQGGEWRMGLVQTGLRSKLTAVMEIEKCSEEEAKKELERIAEDGQITGSEVDWTKGDGNGPGEDTADEEDAAEDGSSETDQDEKGQDADD